MTADERARAIAALAAGLRGDDVEWRRAGATDEQLLELCASEGLGGLLYRRLEAGSNEARAMSLRRALEQEAHASTVRELLRRRELVAVLDALAAGDVRTILLKGAALAYAVYEEPADRPRADTDVLIPRDRAAAARVVLERLGYQSSILCDGDLFCQFEMVKTDAFGIHHAIDCHWKISTQPVFADMLTFDEIDEEAVALPRLHPLARAAAPFHAIFLACLHPAMHHRNVERLIWAYDVHLLASRLSGSDFDRLVELAIARRAAAVVAHELRRARNRFRSAVPDRALARLESARGEPSAEYLRADRHWHDEFLSSMRGLPAWPDRIRLARNVVFPDARYMLRSYGLESSAIGPALLPTLYAHRGIKGVFKVLARRK